MNRQKILIPIFSLVFLIVFVISATYTMTSILVYLTYFATVLTIFIISIFTDKFLDTNFSKILKKMLLVSISALFIGILTIIPQKKMNENKAVKLISEIETYKKQNGKLPNENQIEIPNSINGLNVEKFQYYIPLIEEQNYIIKYFDGFWDTKVYLSQEKKWYVDD